MSPPGPRDEPVVGPVPEGRDPEQYDRIRRRVLWMMPSGIYVLGTRDGSRRNLMTISFAVQMSVDPKLVGVSVEAVAASHELLLEGRAFTLSLLYTEDRALVRKFVKPVEDQRVDEATGAGTMNGAEVRAATTGAPYLEIAAAWIDCEVLTTSELGSHTLFVGEVVDCGSSLLEENADRPVSEHPKILSMSDTRLNYGG